MSTAKLRIAVTTLAASAGLVAAAAESAASQAQWIHYCVAGQCITHQNFTIGGKSPCEAIQNNDNGAYDGLLNALGEKNLVFGGPSPAQAEEEKAKEVAEAEARVREAKREAFTWGCQLARTAPPAHPATSAQTATAASAATLAP